MADGIVDDQALVFQARQIVLEAASLPLHFLQRFGDFRQRQQGEQFQGIAGSLGDGLLGSGNSCRLLGLFGEKLAEIGPRLSQFGIQLQRLLITMQRLRQTLLTSQQVSQVVVKLSRLRFQANRFLEIAARLFRFTAQLVDDAEIIVRRGVARIEAKRLVKTAGSFGEFFLVEIDDAEIAVRRRVGRIELDGLLKASFGLLRLMLSVGDDAGMIIWFREIRPQLGRPRETIQCLTELIAALKNQTQTVMRLGVIGPQPHGLLKTCFGFVEALQGGQHFAEIVVKLRAAGVELDRLADFLGGFFVAAGLMRRHAQQMQRIGVARLRREDTPIQTPSFAQVAGSMAFQSFLQSSCRGRHEGDPSCRLAASRRRARPRSPTARG